MYVESILDWASNIDVYQRGYSLLQRGNAAVTEVTPDGEDPSLLDVRGSVIGSYGDSYSVFVTFDTDAESVADYGCTCMAAAKYDGMCKHAVALALRHLVDIGEIRVADETRRPTSIQSRAVIRTSYGIENLISRYAAKELENARRSADAEMALRETAEDVEPADIQVSISSTTSGNRYYSSQDDLWYLGLKVVRGKASYVVKHIDEVVEAWRERRSYRYGKNLEFVHRPAAFTERANRLLEMLSSVIDAQASLHRSREQRYYYAQPNLTTKTVALSSAQLIEALDILDGSPIIYEFAESYGHGRRGGYRAAVKKTVPIVDGNPRLEVRIEEVDGGFALMISPGAAECVRAGDRLYLFDYEHAWRCSEEFGRGVGMFCEALLPCDDTLEIAYGDMSQFAAAVLPSLREWADVSLPPDADIPLPMRPEFTFRISQEDAYIVCNATVDYGDETLDLFEPSREGQPTRDVPREIAAQGIVKSLFAHGGQETPDYAHPIRRGYGGYSLGRSYLNGNDGERTFGSGSYWSEKAVAATPATPQHPWFPEDDDEAYYTLFSEGLLELAQIGEVLLSERLRNVSVRQSPSVKVEASVAGGLLDLSVSSSDMSPAELMSYLSSYQRKQRFVRLSSGDIVRLDGSVGALGALADGLGVSASDLVAGTASLPTNRTLFVDAMLKKASGVRFERDEGFRRIVRDFDTIADADFALPESLGDILRGYQREGFNWLCTLGASGFGGILADDMGLGKTLQAIAYLVHAKDAGERRPALVVCPASLVYNWMAEVGRFAPGLDAAAVVGSRAERRHLIAEAPSHDLIVTSYDLMKRDIDDYTKVDFSCTVLDEAQYIKNASTKAAKCAKRIPSGIRLALTGTPIENRLAELWSIFDFLMPGVLGSLESFNRRFSTPIANGEEGVSERLRRLVSPFILRRLKGDVLTDLPDKVESIVYSSMDGEQGKLYRANADKLALTLSKQMPAEFAGSKLAILAELTRLRQICCDPHLVYENYTGGSAKLDTCVELVSNAVEGGHGVLVFSQFTSMFELIGERLKAAGIGYLQLTGSTSKEERVRLIERFQAGEAKVFLISLKAGGVGLNLTAADIVIHYDPWWNLAAQNQATDRTHRIGQDKEVSVFKLIAQGTIEEKIVQMQESKRDLAESVLGGEAVSASTITREDILALLEA